MEESLKWSKRRVLLLYTALFLVLTAGVFGRFIYYGKSLIGGADGLSQVGASMVYNGKYYREFFGNLLHGQFSPKVWDLSVGMGMDVTHILIWNPLQIICGMLFVENASLGVAVFTLTSLYLAGLAFLAYCRYTKCNSYAALVAVITYLFNGYILNYCIAQNVFIELYIILPLLLLGVEKLQKEKKSGLFIACVFYLGISLLLNLYTMTLILAGYLIVRYCCRNEKKSIKGFLKEIISPMISYCMAIGLAAVVFIPKIYLSVTSGRVGNAEIGNLLFYEKKYYADLITGLTGTNEIGIHGFIGISTLAVLSVFMLYTSKAEGRIKELKVWGVILALMALMPLGSYLSTGFLGFNHRFLFACIFYFSILIVVMLPKMLMAGIQQKKKVFAWTSIYLVALVLVSLWKKTSLSYMMAFLFLYMGCWLILQENKKYYLWVVLCIASAEVFSLAYTIYEPTQKGYISKFEDSKTVNKDIQIQASSIFKTIRDSSVYRVEDIVSNEKENNREANFGTRNAYSSLDGYYSYMYADIVNTVEDMGISQMGNPFNIYDLDERTALYTLGGVKYLSVYKEDITAMPYGYKLIKEKKVDDHGKKKTLQLYQNQYALPLMYTYSTYIPAKDYLKLNPCQKEQAMLQGVVLESTEAVPRKKPEFNSSNILVKEQIETQIKKQMAKKAKQEELQKLPLEVGTNGITCYETGMKLELQLPEDLEAGEYYLCIENLRYVPKNRIDFQEYYLQKEKTQYEKKMLLKKSRADSNENQKAKITTELQGIKKTAVLWGKDSQYDIGPRNLLFNFGYLDSEKGKLTITLNGRGEYTYSNIYVVRQPMDSYQKEYQELSKYIVKNVEIKNNRITGDIKVPDRRMLCIAIPYHKGFTAFVDGEKTKLEKANGMYMALPVEKGHHTIELEYNLPGQKVGLVVSGIMLMVIIVLQIRGKRRKGVQKDEGYYKFNQIS